MNLASPFSPLLTMTSRVLFQELLERPECDPAASQKEGVRDSPNRTMPRKAEGSLWPEAGVGQVILAVSPGEEMKQKDLSVTWVL